MINFQLYKDRDELIRKNGQARASKALMQEQHDSLKLQLEEKLELRANVEDQLRELDENNHDLRGKLVRSPDRLHEEIKEIEQKNFDRAQLIQDCESSISKMEQQMQILSTEADRHLECFKEEFKTVKADIAAWENAQRMQTQLLMSLDRQRSEKNKLESTEAALARRHENDLSDLNSQLQLCQNKIEHFRALTQKHNE
jgi:chromosome segregation ATPase